MSDTFYITCAIDYPNSPPHLGTAYEKIAADVIARYQRLRGREVRFLMGLDEHSQNVEQKARERGVNPAEYTDEMAGVFADAWAALDISHDIFIRTTEDRHRRAVLELLRRVDAAGDIYTDLYAGWYCVSCEAFYRERDLDEGKCPQHLTEPDWREEENAFFKMSRYTKPLKRHLEEHPEFVQPEIRRNEVMALLEAGLDDISVSRRGEGWGIEMPGHPGQAVYVWFDALTNYLTGIGFPDEDDWERFWPADLHMVGKDITRFHCVIWPSMLMAAGLPLPRTVFGHGFVQRGGGRMSKTIGNVLDPVAAAEHVGVDGLRYFLMREVPFGRDLDFDLDRLEGRYNADLANDLGNLFQRTLSMARKYRDGVLPPPSTGPVTDLPGLGERAVAAYRRAMDDYELQAGLEAAWELVSAANGAIDTHKPWELSRDPGRGDELDAVLRELAETLRCLAILLRPFMPSRAAAMGQQLRLQESAGRWRLSDLEGPVDGEWSLAPGEALFPRYEGPEGASGS